MSLALEVRPHSLIGGLALLVAGAMGCVEAGTSLRWPAADARLAFLFGDDQRSPLRPLSKALIPSADGDRVSLSSAVARLLPGERLVAVLLDEAALLGLHPLVDFEQLEGTEHRADELECSTRRTSDDRAESPVPGTAQVYVEVAGELRPLTESASVIDRSGRLSVAIADRRCENGLRARRFGDDWSVLGQSLQIGGQTYSRDILLDSRAFHLAAAQYLDADRIIVAFVHGLAVIERGQQLGSDRDPSYWSIRQTPEGAALPPDGVPESVRVLGMLADPEVRPGGIRRVAVSILSSSFGSPVTRLAVFEVDGRDIQMVHSTTVAGELSRFRFDADGEILALFWGASPMQIKGRSIAVLGPEDRFGVRTMAQSLRDIEATGRSSPKHLGLSIDGAIIAGDLFDARSWRTLREAPNLREERSGLASAFDDAGLHVFLGSEALGIAHVGPDGLRPDVPVFLDSQVTQAGCRAAQESCGYPGLAPAVRRLWALRDSRGLVLVVAPTTCTQVVAVRPELGCFGLLEVGQQQLQPPGMSPIEGIFPTPGSPNALVIGASGTAYELVLEEPVSEP